MDVHIPAAAQLRGSDRNTDMSMLEGEHGQFTIGLGHIAVSLFAWDIPCPFRELQCAMSSPSVFLLARIKHLPLGGGFGAKKVLG